MSHRHRVLLSLLALAGLCLSPAHAQVIEKMEKTEPGLHAGHGEHHHLQLPLGEAKCEPEFTYELALCQCRADTL